MKTDKKQINQSIIHGVRESAFYLQTNINF
jgi:hypothetical protein